MAPSATKRPADFETEADSPKRTKYSDPFGQAKPKDRPIEPNPPRGERGHKHSNSRGDQDSVTGIKRESRSTSRALSPPREPRAARRNDKPARSTPKTSGPSSAVHWEVNSEGLDPDMKQMQAAMGFTSFRSTKNTKVPGNDKNYGVRRNKTAEYRQYMNRPGGFNRPLSPSLGTSS